VTHAFKDSHGKYKWHANDFRPRPGRFFARVSSTPACQADNSKTLRISRRPDTKITSLDTRSGKREAIIEYRGVGGVRPYTYRFKLDGRRYRDVRFGKAHVQAPQAGLPRLQGLQHRRQRKAGPDARQARISHLAPPVHFCFARKAEVSLHANAQALIQLVQARDTARRVVGGTAR
jgi:hypothetical protein